MTPPDGRCHCLDCSVREHHKGPGSSKCKRKSVVYQSLCQLCLDLHYKPAIYIDETGRSLYERVGEHLEDARKMKSFSHIYKHWALVHPDDHIQPLFKFKVLRSHPTPMSRQIHEAIWISSYGVLNSKSDYRQNQVKQLKVNFTVWDIKKVEADMAKDDAKVQVAIKPLN